MMILRNGEVVEVADDPLPIEVVDLLDNSLSAVQFEAALELLGIDRADVEPAISAAMAGDDVARAFALAGWRRLRSISRDNPILAVLIADMGIDGAAVDATWRQVQQG